MLVLKRALPLGGIVFALLSSCMAADKNGPDSGVLIPTIALSTAEVEFAASVDGKDPSAMTISVSGLSGYTPTAVGLGNITYGGGQVGDWLQASISGSPAIITLHPTVLGLSVGVYEAFVPVLDPGATNSPQVVHVVFEVSGKPSIALSASQVAFGAAPGGTPQPQSVTVSSMGGPAELSDLAIVNVTYAAGEPQGWLSATLSSTSTPSVLNLTPSTASLPVGTYTASVGISDSAALNSPRNLAVTLEISNNPILAISPNTMVFNSVEGGGGQLLRRPPFRMWAQVLSLDSPLDNRSTAWGLQIGLQWYWEVTRLQHLQRFK